MRQVIAWILMALSVAATAQTPEQKALKAIQDQFQATFTNMPVVAFDRGPFDGLYELNINGNLIYYHADSELLFFGEIYNKYGKSLTAEKKALLAQTRMQQLPLDKAVVIGPDDGIPIIEFTDPDCPFCRSYSEFIQKQSTARVKRLVFFYTRIHPDAAKKAEHIICSKDQEQAFHDVFNGKNLKWKSCKEGAELLAIHDKASKDMGLSGTPSFAIDGALVTGFKQKAIEEYLARKSLSQR